jgi:phosphate transport system substrate-binding protein
MRLSMATVLTLTTCLLLGFTLSNAQSQEAKTVIRVKGSDDMASRVDTLARLFMKENPQVTIIVSAGARTSGMSDLVDRNCELVMSGHDFTDEEKQAAREKGIQLDEHLVGYGGLGFLTYPENTVDELTLEQVQKLIRGDYNNWSQVGGPNEQVVIISLEALNSDVRLYLLHDFLHVPTVRSRVERMNSFQGILKKVAETKGALGFCRIRDLEVKDPSEGAKVLKIKTDPGSPGIMPSRTSIADGSYPLKRPFYLCMDSKAGDPVKRFAAFIVSKGWGASK